MPDFATAFEELLAATDDADVALTFVAAAQDIRSRRETTERQVRSLLERTVAATATAQRIHAAAERRHAELETDENVPTMQAPVGIVREVEITMNDTAEIERPMNTGETDR